LFGSQTALRSARRILCVAWNNPRDIPPDEI
jgi:hypothetical protein